jgi:hypothetical protein
MERTNIDMVGGYFMFYQVQLWKGLTSPYVSSHQLNKAEQFHGLWKRTSLILVLTLIISAFSSYLGIENEQLSKLIYETSSSEFESIKGLFAIGQVLQSIFVSAILIFLPALVFWVFTDIEYRKLIVIQLFVAGIFILEKIITLPLQFFFGLDLASSPFSLGIIAQYLTDYEIIINFLGEVSLFSIWAMILQYKYLRVITDKKNSILVILILSINLFLWIFTAIFSFIKFEIMI